MHEDGFPYALASKPFSKETAAKIERAINTRTVDADVRRQLQQIQHDKEVAARMDLAKRYGNDTYQNGTVLQFGKQFKGDSRTFTFAAIKAVDTWWLSGRGASFTWLDLVAFLVSDVPVDSVAVLTESGRYLPARDAANNG